MTQDTPSTLRDLTSGLLPWHRRVPWSYSELRAVLGSDQEPSERPCMAPFRAPTADPSLGSTCLLRPRPASSPTPPPGRGSKDAPVEAVAAGPMDAGVAAALVDLRQAGGVVVALGAATGEAVDAILAGAPVVARAVRTLVNVDVTHTPCGRPSSSDTRSRRGVGLPALGASVSLSVSTPLPPLHPRPSRGSDSHRYKLCSRDPGPTLDTLGAEGSMCTGSLAPL